MSDELLKPCPKCAGKADMMVLNPKWLKDVTIRCAKCSYKIQRICQEQAIAAWNKQARWIGGDYGIEKKGKG